MTKTIYANCYICGNESSYDKESLKGSTHKINGVSGIVLCIPCEDSIFNQFLRARLSEKRGREIADLLMSEEGDDIRELYDYGVYEDDE